MPNIIGVKFNDAGKVYYFDPGTLTMRYHDHVIVETARGLEYGTVVISPTEVDESKIHGELKTVVRIATEEDDERIRENKEKEKEAYRTCKQKIAEHGLDMKLIEAEYTFDNSKLLFYFTADGRIDFRELVKDLAGVFRTRIELRQIGVRDETKIIGGCGICGRPLCCHTWLNEFAPVSIKMAKDQNLSLNPSKISGTCGRLMCCLKNEADTYAYLNKDLPSKGDYATTPDGLHGDVHSVNILRQSVKVIVELENDEKELQEFDVADLTFIPKAEKLKMREKEGAEQKKENSKKQARARDREASKNPDVRKEQPDNSAKAKTSGNNHPDARKEQTDGFSKAKTSGNNHPDARKEQTDGSVKAKASGNTPRQESEAHPDKAGGQDQKEEGKNGPKPGNRGARTASKQGTKSARENAGESGEKNVKESVSESGGGEASQQDGSNTAAKKRRRKRRPHRPGKEKGSASEG